MDHRTLYLVSHRILSCDRQSTRPSPDPDQNQSAEAMQKGAVAMKVAHSLNQNPLVAVLIPCYNEGQTIGKVVLDFRRVLPEATIYVYDNASNDDTATQALSVGAVVKTEPTKGKGNVVRRMFADVEADV
ncbi:MAG: glycosyltransferase [Pseudomonadota bacterium]